MKRSAKIPFDEFVREHKQLTNTLKNGTEKERQDEGDEQMTELERFLVRQRMAKESKK